MQALSLASEATKIVIPVRYVARGQVVHATSTALTADDVHVRSANPPPRECRHREPQWRRSRYVRRRIPGGI